MAVHIVGHCLALDADSGFVEIPEELSTEEVIGVNGTQFLRKNNILFEIQKQNQQKRKQIKNIIGIHNK